MDRRTPSAFAYVRQGPNGAERGVGRKLALPALRSKELIRNQSSREMKLSDVSHDLTVLRPTPPSGRGRPGAPASAPAALPPRRRRFPEITRATARCRSSSESGGGPLQDPARSSTSRSGPVRDDRPVIRVARVEPGPAREQQADRFRVGPVGTEHEQQMLLRRQSRVQQLGQQAPALLVGKPVLAGCRGGCAASRVSSGPGRRRSTAGSPLRPDLADRGPPGVCRQGRQVSIEREGPLAGPLLRPGAEAPGSRTRRRSAPEARPPAGSMPATLARSRSKPGSRPQSPPTAPRRRRHYFFFLYL